jgi:hypothetical protein
MRRGACLDGARRGALSLVLGLLASASASAAVAAATTTGSSTSSIIAEGAKRLEVDAARVVSNVSSA